ncbi:hypothetical protein [Methanosarcina sp. UBA5]|uniref:hypothetical protein n=1 Tax=Methanosarcina sp. UBA5 TaxID=1915593 RepID=UPI0025CF8A60|nr:hypothetical protein [Methanosarcina sp. UBA5]
MDVSVGIYFPVSIELINDLSGGVTLLGIEEIEYCYSVKEPKLLSSHSDLY